MVVKPLTEDKWKALEHSAFRCLDVVNYWIGDTEVYLKAEELLPTETYEFVTAADTPPSHGGYINLGDLKKNHWADRVVKVNKKTSLATGAVTISSDELMDFLGIAMATFGIFRVKMPDGATSLYIYCKRLESCKFNHLTVLGAKSSNINNCNNEPKHADLHNVIQFVNGGAILRLDKLDSTTKKICQHKSRSGQKIVQGIFHTLCLAEKMLNPVTGSGKVPFFISS